MRIEIERPNESADVRYNAPWYVRLALWVVVRWSTKGDTLKTPYVVKVR
jgi:hypothetical protein